MDLNYLLARHQTSLMLADRAACRPSRIVHRTMAARYATRIQTLRRSADARGRLLPEGTAA